MAELIGCRECDSPSCKGCNIKILADMLNRGKFNSLMNKNRRVDCGLDIAPVVHGEWEVVAWVEPDYHSYGTIKKLNAAIRCKNCCHAFKKELLWEANFCPNCGAKMNGGAE